MLLVTWIPRFLSAEPCTYTSQWSTQLGWGRMWICCVWHYSCWGTLLAITHNFHKGCIILLICTLADTRLTGAVIRGGSFMSTLHQGHWWLQDLLTGRTFLGTTSLCWPWSWVRRMQTVHRLKRYNRQSRLRDLNSAIHMFLRTEWEAVLTELLFWHQQAKFFLLFFMPFFTGWWGSRGWQLNAECCFFNSLVFQGFI